MFQGNAIYVYTIAGIISFVFARLANGSISKTKEGTLVKNVKTIPFIISFLILWGVMVFTDSGIDYYNYYKSLSAHHSLVDVFGYASQTEPFMTFVTWLVWRIFPSAHMAIFVIKSIGISMFFYSIYLYRDHIDLGLSVLAYFAVIYVPSVHLISIHVAASFVLLSSYFIYKQNDWKKFLLCVVLAIGFHYSALIVLFPWFLYLFMVKRRGNFKMKPLQFLEVMIIYIVGLIGFGEILNVLMEYVPIIGKYAGYVGKVENHGLGLYKFFLYIPIAIMLFYLKKNERLNAYLYYTLICAVAEFTLRILSGNVGILSRIYYHFSALFCVFIPYFYNEVRKGKMAGLKSDRFHFLFSRRVTSFMIVCYFVVQIIVKYKEVLDPANIAGLYQYNFIIPWKM